MQTKTIRESSTPVREFVPPSTKNAMPIFRNTVGEDQARRFNNTPVQEQPSYIDNTLIEPSIMQSQYQTIQDTTTEDMMPEGGQESRSFEPLFNKTPQP